MPNDLISNHGAAKVSRLIPLEFCQFLTHVLMRKSLEGQQGDTQCPNAKAVMVHDVMLDSVLERLWPTVEKIVGAELLPTYAYARLYTNGDTLEKHVDRESCEVSLTIQLAKSHNWSYPIYMGDKEYHIDEGEAVIYDARNLEHWREECRGPEGYYSGQLFLHYVRKNGEHSIHAGDPEFRPEKKPAEFEKYRTASMELK